MWNNQDNHTSNSNCNNWHRNCCCDNHNKWNNRSHCDCCHCKCCNNNRCHDDCHCRCACCFKRKFRCGCMKPFLDYDWSYLDSNDRNKDENKDDE